MNAVIAVIVIVAVALLLVGGLVNALQFLLWVGVVLAVCAVIVALVRYLTGQRTAR